MKISICLAIRNGEKYMSYLEKLFHDIENTYKNYIFEFFIYENNSTDQTKKAIEKFAINRNCRYLLEDIENNTMKEGINIERGKHMATIRNKLKDFHGKLDSDYVLLFDCDVIFLPNTIEKLIQTINDKIVMASCFCICWHTYSNNNNSIHYYDCFAVISNNNISYKENANTCLFKSCSRCINHRNHVNVKINNDFLFDNNKLVNVKSCFGSLSLIKTDVYNNVNWDDSICEHHSFCEKVNKYGSIVINPQIKIFTTIPRLNNNYDNIKKKLEKIA
jgi:hypothetical protein